MLVNRWQAPMVPTKDQLKMILNKEGLECSEEHYPTQTKITDHRHPFNEVRVIVDGELIVNVAGNQLLLRAGDRIEIPANTKHSHFTQNTECTCLFAERPF